MAQLLFFIIGMFLLPIAEHSFFLKALEKMYLASTEDSSMFTDIFNTNTNNDKDQFLTITTDMPPIFKNTKFEQRVRFHHPIKLTWRNRMKLLAIRIFECFICKDSAKSESSQLERLVRLYYMGKRRLEKDLSVEYILK